MPNSAAEHLNAIIKAYLRSSRRKQLQNSFSQLSQLSPPAVVNQPSNSCEKNPSEDTVSGGAWRGNKEALFIAQCDELIIRSRLSTRSLFMTLSFQVNRMGLPLEKGTWEPSLDANDCNAAVLFLLFAYASLGPPKKAKTHEPFASSLLGVKYFFSLQGRKQQPCQLHVWELDATRSCLGNSLNKLWVERGEVSRYISVRRHSLI